MKADITKHQDGLFSIRLNDLWVSFSSSIAIVIGDRRFRLDVLDDHIVFYIDDLQSRPDLHNRVVIILAQYLIDRDCLGGVNYSFPVP